MKDDTVKTKAKDAIAYIKESPFYIDGKNAWLKSLIEKVISGDYYDRNLDEVLQLLFPDYIEVKTAPASAEPVTSKPALPKVAAPLSVKCIDSIEKLENSGLLNISEPLPLKKNTLNVFFGANAAGKSSIYTAICKTLGKADKKVIPNIYEEKQDSLCELKYQDENEVESKLQWQTGQENAESPVMIFDSQISNYLITADQENEFKIAHLKSEYFQFLQQMYVKLETKLSSIKTVVGGKLEGLEAGLSEKFGAEFLIVIQLTAEQLKQSDFTDKEAEKLESQKASLAALNKASTASILKNLSNALVTVRSLLNVLSNEVEDDSGKKIRKIIFTEANIKLLNEKVENYAVKRDALKNDHALTKALPADWLSKEEWIDFVTRGVAFLRTLDETNQKKYEEEYCLYCQQVLGSDEAKSLMGAYRSLKQKHEGVVEAELNEISKAGEKIEAVKNSLLNSLNNKKIIEDEFSNIGRTKLIETDFDEVTRIFEELDGIAKNLKKKEIAKKDVAVIEAAVKEYSDIEKALVEKIAELDEALKNVATQISQYESKIEQAEKKKKIEENKDKLAERIKLSETQQSVVARSSEITEIKRATSTLETRFSKDERLNIFESILKTEYESLRFTPTEKWKIKSTTQGGINKRVYNMGSRRLAEIFSEGEKKIHALADFFAQGVVNEFKGVYIFDDPVTSLDEENIEAVANRIKKIVEDGNQVIVFTHNIVFLNCLVNTSRDRIHKLHKYQTQVFLERDIILGDKRGMKVRLDMIRKNATDISSRAKKGEDIPVLEMGGVYDLMSGYIEDYVEKIILKDLVARYRPNIRMDGISALKEIDSAKVDKAAELYKRTSRYGTRHSQARTQPNPKPEELEKDFTALEAELKY